MTQKSGIIAALGEEALLLPEFVERAIVANEQAKYYLSLLQLARQRAEHPGMIRRALRAEREAAGIDDTGLDRVMAGSLLVGDGRYRVLYLDRILDGVRDAIDAMIRPLAVLGEPDADTFRARADALAPVLLACRSDEIDREGIRALTSGDRSAGDSPHLLVMDLHRALAMLVESLDCERIDGGVAYQLDGPDRDLVRAFMRGLNRTAPLGFGHPGLATTAIRAGGRLLLQNDIGVTGVHVLVVSVAEATVTVTYTDVHAARLAFFRSLFDDREVRWSETVSRSDPDFTDGGTYHLLIGTLRDRNRCLDFLEHLGSRIVFLIDWNKARKQLRAFAPDGDAVTVLARAASDEVGHRAFLELGGTDLIDEALSLAAHGRPGSCGPLHLQLGREAIVECLGGVLATAADGLLREEPRSRVRERCGTVVLQALEEARGRFFERCGAHAGLVVEVAFALRDSVDTMRSEAGRERTLANAVRARRCEREADLLVAEARGNTGLPGDGELLLRLLTIQDAALDALEEGCSYAALFDERMPLAGELDTFREMATLAFSAGQSYLRALSAVRQSSPGGDPGPEFLAETHRVAVAMQECGSARSRAERHLIAGEHGPRDLQAGLGLARAVAASTAALSEAVTLLRGCTFASAAGTGDRAVPRPPARTPLPAGAAVTSGPLPSEAPRSP